MKITALIAILAAFLANEASAEVITRCNSAGMMALTFDDGPAEFTGELLSILKSKGARVTFHLTTKHLTDPNVQASLQSISSAGHLIGLRTEADWDLFKMTDDQIRSSVARQANVMARLIGYYPKFVRLPYQGYDARVLKAVESTGAVVTSHNLDTYDYSKDANRVLSAYQLATSLLAPGAGSFITVQHDGIQESVAVTGKVIDVVKDAGYKLVTLDACLGMGDMTKNKVALKGDDGKGGAVTPLKGGDLGSGGKIPGGSPIGGGGSKGISSGPLDDDDDAPVRGKGKNDAGSAAKLSGIGMAAVACVMAALIF